MDRRKILRLSLLGLCGSLPLGCKTRRVRYDEPPERGLFEDRWSGHQFSKLDASYALLLVTPDPSLSRKTGIEIPIVSNRDDAPSFVPETPSIRPSTALVSLAFDAESAKDSVISVTLRWPRKPDSIMDTKRYDEETMTANLSFWNVKRFINGTGRFQCDEDDCFYGRVREISDAPMRDLEDEVRVAFSIAGPSPDSNQESNFNYENRKVLWDIAKVACPGLA